MSEIERITRIAATANGKPQPPAPAAPATAVADEPGACINGASFVLDAPTHVPAIWGQGNEVLWSEGEALLLTGPQGVGKSTIVQQCVRARMGLSDSALGYPVRADPRPVLLLALDRPPQIARSMRRMFTAEDRATLTARLRVRTALTTDIVAKPEHLAELVRREQAGTLIIDSLKDTAVDLSSGEVGAALTRAMRLVLAHGCEVAAVHHHRKAQAENKRPRTLADVYGSTWLTSGAGSVVCLWGEPGDVLVELIHLKQPAEEVGPLKLEHDHSQGVTTVHAKPDAWNLLNNSRGIGITAPDAAKAIYGAKASKSQTQKIRRRFDRFVEDGFARRTPGLTATDPVVYHPTAEKGRVEQRGAERGVSTQAPRTPTIPPRMGPRCSTQDGAPRTPLKGRGARGAKNDPENDPSPATSEEEERAERALRLISVEDRR